MHSRLSALECRVGPWRRGDAASLERFDAFCAQPDLHWVGLSAAVVDLATHLRVLHGLRTPDAVILTGDGNFHRVAGLQIRLIL